MKLSQIKTETPLYEGNVVKLIDDGYYYVEEKLAEGNYILMKLKEGFDITPEVKLYKQDYVVIY